MADATQLTVKAEGSIQVTPDRATLDFRVRVRGQVRARTVQRARAKLAQLTQTLDRHHVSHEQRRTEQITATQLFDPKTRKGVGYEASALTTVRLSDFTDLGGLIDAVASQGGVDVTGPQWEVSATHLGHLEACRRATASAQRRAQAFAEGVGMSLGRLVTMQEEEVWQHQQAQMTASLAAGPSQEGSAPGSVSIWSGVVRLTSAVTATFEVQPATTAKSAPAADAVSGQGRAARASAPGRARRVSRRAKQ
jgi:uncharacterized protein